MISSSAWGAFLPALVVAQWRFAPGDPDMAGWIITFAYLVAFALCAAAANRSHNEQGALRRKEYQLFWLLLMAVMLALGVNKQMELQTLLTDVGRFLFRREGWLTHRRLAQGVFLSAAALVLFVSQALAWWNFRTMLAPQWPAVAGLVTLTLFVLMRAALFWRLSLPFPLPGKGSLVHHFMEAGGVAAIAWSAGRYLIRPPAASVLTGGGVHE